MTARLQCHQQMTAPQPVRRFSGHVGGAARGGGVGGTEVGPEGENRLAVYAPTAAPQRVQRVSVIAGACSGSSASSRRRACPGWP